MFSSEGSPTDTTTSDSDVLVLEVPLGSTRVQLARKRYGDRYVQKVADVVTRWAIALYCF